MASCCVAAYGEGDESLNFMSSTKEGYVHMYDWYNDIVSLILHAYNLFRIIYLYQTGCWCLYARNAKIDPSATTQSDEKDSCPDFFYSHPYNYYK